jgi:glycosyltransferase involved in cell wall biosynthesis
MRLIERQSAKKAGGIVTLTAAAIDELERRHGPSVRNRCRVITTCVDLNRFHVSPMPPPEPLNLLLAGTLSRRYDVPLMLRLVDELRRRRCTQLTALIPVPSPWVGALQDAGVHIQRAAAVDMPAHLRASHAGLSVLRPGDGVAMKASMPTKVGEFLASGRPVVVNAGLGDLDQLLADYRCGVILSDDTPESLVAGADSIEQLLADRDTPARCRKLAQDNFRLETAIDDLIEVYERAI